VLTCVIRARRDGPLRVKTFSLTLHSRVLYGPGQATTRFPSNSSRKI